MYSVTLFIKALTTPTLQETCHTTQKPAGFHVGCGSRSLPRDGEGRVRGRPGTLGRPAGNPRGAAARSWGIAAPSPRLPPCRRCPPSLPTMGLSLPSARRPRTTREAAAAQRSRRRRRRAAAGRGGSPARRPMATSPAACQNQPLRWASGPPPHRARPAAAPRRGARWEM